MKTNSCLPRLTGLLLLFVLLCSNRAYAQQQQTTSADDLKRFDWDFSADMKFLFNSNYGQGDVLLRKNKEKRLKTWGMRYTAFRYRLQFNHQKTTSDALDDLLSSEEVTSGNYSMLYYSDKTLQSTNLKLSVGYEWQQYFGRFMVHYGSDLQLSRSVEEREYSLYLRKQDDVESKMYKDASKKKSTSLGIALAPVLGARYFLHPRISVTAETQLNISRSSTDYTVTPSELGNHNFYYYDPYAGNSRDKTTSLQYTPVSFLGITLHLGK
ncbi:hypothetical protein MKJ04_07710 [Pontibacter sp. E15-1]|uniref:hypothetical protein n=1 Tax=Pontibacter sp. E15-1 TaxID=2919918 RepID=UPI001F4FF717|nr:hypothetical protein [Pontibacter sp. E15-1]MCJ8164725.1 hypothetical protein [Pontibacter sp. E15-1]